MNKGLLFLLIFSSLVTSGQEIGGTFMGGQIKKHSPRLRYETPPLTLGGEASYVLHTSQKQDWAEFWGFPDIALNVSSVNFGNRAVLGQAWGLFPSVHFTLFTTGSIRWRWSAGSGLAFLNKKYDEVENPANNAIGSHWNNVTRFGWHAEKNRFGLCLYLYHYSNGRTASPNSGINIFMLGLNHKWPLRPKERATIEYQRKSFDASRPKKWGLDLMASRGWTRWSVDGGPSFGVYALSMAIYTKAAERIRIMGGYEFENNRDVYSFYINDFHTEKEARSLSQRNMVHLAAEFNFGRFAFRPRFGYYLSGDKTGSTYIKLESLFYPLGWERRPAPYVGIFLKSHIAVAQNISVLAGFNF